MAIQLISNRGFESGHLAPGWRQTPGSAALEGGVTDTVCHAGTYSLMLRSMDFVEQPFLSTICRATGELTFYAKAASDIGAGPFSVRIEYADGSVDTPLIGALTTHWTQKRVAVNKTKQLRKVVFGTGETDAVYIDDVSLVGSRKMRLPSAEMHT